MDVDIEKHNDTKPQQPISAPGRPGIKPSWSTGAKTAVGTSITTESRVWFTIAHGFLNEIYFPDVDKANTRFVRFLAAGEDDFFSDEAGGTEYTVQAMAAGIPAYRVSSHCKHKRYSLEKEIITDPERDALLIKVSFQPSSSAKGLRLYVFSNPHVGDEGEDNNGWAGEYKGMGMLFAQRNGLALAIACSTPFKQMSCGFMGVSDGLTEICANGRLAKRYTLAEQGNIGLTGEIDWTANAGNFTLALAFGGTPSEAGQQARAALLRDFAEVRTQYVSGWSQFQASISDLSRSGENDLFRVSAAISRIHESKRFRGAFVASLSIPWGFDRGDKDIGGYHVIWPRDLCEAVLGLLACGDTDSARRALFYLECTQDADGHWPQNMWLDGTRHWTSKQMDETAFPILLADALRRFGELKNHNAWAVVKKAASYVVRHGPLAEQDRWEQTAGYATFTVAVDIAALLAAADFADLNGEAEEAQFLRETADAWNEAVDELIYASGTGLARQCGVPGYYLRLTPPDAIRGTPLDELTINLKNHPKGHQTRRVVDIASPDALALVKYGLRAADDPRILDTVKVIDATLKTVTSTGPVWHRYSGDGYGEHEDGSPYNNKTGVGRGWPLLGGERAHYELARGNMAAAEELRQAIERQSNECGLIPEQIWDAEDIPERELYNGLPTGSGMPLVWAHAEYLQLLRSLRDGKVWRTPPQTVERYVKAQTKSAFQIWTMQQQRGLLTPGKNLRIDLPGAGTVEWTLNCWSTVQQVNTKDSGLGIHYAMLEVSDAAPGARIRFRIPEADRKERQEFEIVVNERH
jgi:glucoamylase